MQTMPDYDQSLLQFINTVDPCLVLVHALLHGTPNFVIHGVQVRAVGGGGWAKLRRHESEVSRCSTWIM